MTTRKVDFRISEEEYDILLICARSKEMTVSRYLRAIVASCIAPAILTTTPEMRKQALDQINKTGGCNPR